MHIVAKIGLIILIVGIGLAALGFVMTLTSTSSIVSVVSKIQKLSNATKVVLSPQESKYIEYTITSIPSLVIFAYNSTSPISVIVPAGFQGPFVENNTVVYVYGATSTGTITINLINNQSVPVTIYYEFSTSLIGSEIVFAGLVLILGFILVIVGLILLIVGLIIGRRKS